MGSMKWCLISYSNSLAYYCDGEISFNVWLTVWKDFYKQTQSDNSLSVGQYFAVGTLLTVWPDKNRQMSVKVASKWFHYKNDRF